MIGKIKYKNKIIHTFYFEEIDSNDNFNRYNYMSWKNGKYYSFTVRDYIEVEAYTDDGVFINSMKAYPCSVKTIQKGDIIYNKYVFFKTEKQ